MDSKDIRGLCEAYVAVYDEDLRDELEDEYMEEDWDFIDELSDQDLDIVMESILYDDEININECFDSLDYLLTEAKVTSSETRSERPRQSSSRVTMGASDRARAERMALSKSARKKQVRLGRVAQAAERAKEKVTSKTRRAAGVVTGRLKAAKEKIVGGLKKVGRAGREAYRAAHRELSGQAEREARAKRTGMQLRDAARRGAAKASARASFAKPSDPWAGSATAPKKSTSTSTTSTRRLSGSPSRPALPAGQDSPISARRQAAQIKMAKSAAGSTSRGVRFAGGGQVAPQRSHTGQKAALEKFHKKAGLTQEEFEFILGTILEDLIYEGYAETYDDALELIESISEYEFEDLVESYIEENTEAYDFYDDIMEHLIENGYADDEDSATIIMANMSEEWRAEILDEELTGERASRAAKIEGEYWRQGKNRSVIHRLLEPSNDQTSFGRGNKARRRIGLNPAPRNAGPNYH